MTTSATEICNLALDLLSSETVLNVVSPDSAVEDLLNRWYDKSRRKVLRGHPWNFAIQRVTLSATGTAPAFEYSAQFRVPSGFIRLLAIQDGGGGQIWKDQYGFENNHILYSGDAVRLRYISDHTDVPTMDDLFIDLLVLEIALSIAYKNTGSNSDVERLLKLKKESSKEAKAIDGQENPPKRIERSKIMQKRRAGSRTRTDII